MVAQRYLTILRERWVSALLTGLLVIGIVAGVTAIQRPAYEASASLFVRTGAGDSVTDRSTAADYARQQVTTYAELVETPLVLDPVIDALGMTATAGQLAERVSSSVPEDSLFVNVTARAGNPDASAELANAVADSLRAQVALLEADDATAVELTVVAPATTPVGPTTPNVMQNGVLGVAAALLAGALIAISRDLLDNKVRKAEDIHLLTDAPLMATIPASRATDSVMSVTDRGAHGIHAEAYRELRTNLRFLQVGDTCRSLVVTSSVKGEGKSETAINLSGVIAKSGCRVLLVDADLRDPSVHRYLGLEGNAGLSTVLIGDAELDDVVQPLDDGNLSVLASGPVPPNPSELLDSDRMATFLEAAAERFDVVILDSAPILAVTDTTAIARRASGTVFVTGSGVVRRPQVAHALQKLQLVQGRLLGIVLTRVPRSDRSVYSQVYGSASTAQSSTQAAAADRPSARHADGREEPSRPPATPTAGAEHSGAVRRGTLVGTTEAPSEDLVSSTRGTHARP